MKNRRRCYLSVEPVSIGLECFGCTLPAEDGPLVAWTEELRPGKPEPVCLYCLRSLDPALARFYDIAADLAIAARVIAEGAGDLDGEPADPVPARHTE